MSHSTKHFHAGKAAAAFTASQQQPAPRVASQRQPGAGYTDTYERARQQRDARPRRAYVPPELPTPAYILICAELARLAVALHFALAFRVWLVIHQLAYETNTTGFTRAEIEAALRRYNVKFSQRNLTRWLRLGVADGLFWHYDTITRRYYHRGYVSLSETLVNHCIDAGKLALIETNFPGQRKPVHINVASDNLLQFESNCYEGWIGSRENLQISREMQSTLWDRTLPVILSWERSNTNVLKTASFTFCDEDNYEAIPKQADGSWRPDVRRTVLFNRDVIAWQLPNCYRVRRVRQHAYKGQLRRAYVRIKKSILALQPADDCEYGSGLSAASGGANRIAKRYFSSNKGAKQSAKLTGERGRHVFKGRWGDRYNYFEYTPDGKEQFTFWHCRKVFRRHQCVCFAKRLKKIVVFKEVDTHPC